VKIPTNIVGHALTPLSCEVSWRQTSNFAAGVGDINPCYLDDTRQGGLQVHPVFPVRLSWPLIANIAEQLDGLVPAEAIFRMVHAYERIAWRRPLVPGDSLRLEGKIVSVGSTPAGALVVIEIEARRPNSELVYFEDIGGLFRGVATDGPDAGRKIEPISKEEAGPMAGRPVWRESFGIQPIAPFLYDGCSQIVFPIHTSQSFARGVGLQGIILQGTCALAMATSRVLRHAAGGDPSRARELSCRFRRPVFPGTDVSLEISSESKRAGTTEITFRLLNADGDAAIEHGFLKLADLDK